jgi:oxalate decarboxylase
LDSDVDGREFLLVFDDGSFSEDSTFLLTDWLAHTPPDVLAKNFRTSESKLKRLPSKALYIFPALKPGALPEDRKKGTGPVPNISSHRLLQQRPNQMANGSVRIVDSTNFPASKTIAAALVELEPGGLRELHGHPNTDEWQYYIQGEGRMTVFGSESKARTFDYRAGDIGYVPFAMGHYIENTGSGPLRFLEMFRSERYADLSLNQWLALTPRVVDAHLKIDPELVAGLSAAKVPVLPK